MFHRRIDDRTAGQYLCHGGLRKKAIPSPLPPLPRKRANRNQSCTTANTSVLVEGQLEVSSEDSRQSVTSIDSGRGSIATASIILSPNDIATSNDTSSSDCLKVEMNDAQISKYAAMGSSEAGSILSDTEGEYTVLSDDSDDGDDEEDAHFADALFERIKESDVANFVADLMSTNLEIMKKFDFIRQVTDHEEYNDAQSVQSKVLISFFYHLGKCFLPQPIFMESKDKRDDTFYQVWSLFPFLPPQKLRICKDSFIRPLRNHVRNLRLQKRQ